ncbi:MAG: methyltransferase domain-containing protein [Alphaproteobacteria bacterium]|nr:methyltransferase domain-containing protein [Alphaproteobacteria bacterium]
MSDGPSVTAHYGTGSLRQIVEDALRRAGLDAPHLSWSDLTPLDQFHVRGLAATKELAAALPLAPESHVLDVGSGLGGPARFLAATTGCRVTGIDLSAAFVEVATMLAQRAGLAGRVTYREADALALPFAEASFDHAWTQHVAMNIADRARLYGEIRRVLKPSGRLAIYDVVEGEGGDLIFPVPWARVPEISFLATAEAMRAALTAAGFSELSFEDKTDAGLTWYAEQQARAAAGTRPALGIHVVMGAEFPGMAANLGRNLREGRARLVQAVVERR